MAPLSCSKVNSLGGGGGWRQNYSWNEPTGDLRDWAEIWGISTENHFKEILKQLYHLGKAFFLPSGYTLYPAHNLAESWVVAKNIAVSKNCESRFGTDCAPWCHRYSFFSRLTWQILANICICINTTNNPTMILEIQMAINLSNFQPSDSTEGSEKN